MFVDDIHVRNLLYSNETGVAGHTSAALLTLTRMIHGDDAEVQQQYKQLMWNSRNIHLSYRRREEIRRKLEHGLRKATAPKTMADVFKRRTI